MTGLLFEECISMLILFLVDTKIESRWIKAKDIELHSKKRKILL